MAVSRRAGREPGTAGARCVVRGEDQGVSTRDSARAAPAVLVN